MPQMRKFATAMTGGPFFFLIGQNVFTFAFSSHECEDAIWCLSKTNTCKKNLINKPHTQNKLAIVYGEH